ncbi:MAG: thiolase family protein [Alphaproteobacteria bacterium]|nr:thiolase family protein [Alphaproteobacteria bacterium]
MSDDIVILGGARTPIGRFGGGMTGTTAVDIGAAAIKAAVANAGIALGDIDLCVMGNARQAGNGPNPGRLMALKGGLPKTAPTYTVQMACISGLLAVMQARHAILEGDAEVVLAGGSEHMSSIPYLLRNARWGNRMGNEPLVDALSADGFIDPLTGAHMGKLCDDMARREGISRADQDAFAMRSQATAAAAQQAGHLRRMSVAVEVPGRKGPTTVDSDEHMRPDTTADALRALKPVFVKDGTVTAGNASGITDGACALVIASAKAAKRLGKTPRARIMGATLAALQPEEYTLAPVESTLRLAKRLGVDPKSCDSVEINEAFAAMVLACVRKLGLDPERVNTWGGAIALGHPIGMSGARILLTLLHRLEAEGGKIGLAAICGNGGHGASMLIERAA